MADDVVAELDRWLDNSNDRTTAIERRVVLRARDEIVALREKVFIFAASNEEEEMNIRAEALEEAAQVCFRANPQSNPNAMGHAIRALKEKRPN